MNSEVLNLVLMLYILGAFALQAKNWHSWLVIFMGVFIACAGAAAGYDFINRGNLSGSSFAMYAGQVVMVFGSVIGGALASTAFTELRNKSKHIANG